MPERSRVNNMPPFSNKKNTNDREISDAEWNQAKAAQAELEKDGVDTDYGNPIVAGFKRAKYD